jgi:nucleotide-binding universal stress UspA family protein
MADTRILLAIDDSAASKRAVKYVARLVGRRKGFRICLVHVLPPLPPALLEHGGSENPQQEVQLEVDLRAEQEHWTSKKQKEAQGSLDKASATLRKAGLSAKAVQTIFCEPADGRAAAEDILRMARECKCQTVVAGRQSVSWFHELFSQDLAEELMRCGKGFTVWLVE